MPIYDYRCNQCATTFEIRLSFSEKDEGVNPLCPNCSSPDTRQVISGGTVLRTGLSLSGNAPNACAPRTGGGCCEG